MNDPSKKPKRKLSPDAEYVLDLLVAAGHITREKAFQCRDIALQFAATPNHPPPSIEQGERD